MKMEASTVARPEWTALQVRQTFLDYFVKQRQHTFGELTIVWNEALANYGFDSSLLVRCAALRSDPPLHQCWHEPVQGNLPRYR